MLLEKISSRSPRIVRGDRDRRIIQTIVAAPVPEIVAESIPNTKDVVGSHCHVSAVIKAMQVAP